MSTVNCEKKVYPFLCQVLDKNFIIYETVETENCYEITTAMNEDSFNNYLNEAKALRDEIFSEVENSELNFKNEMSRVS